MKDFSNLEEWTPKRLRTLRNNLNNRISSFEKDGKNVKNLQASHMLYGQGEEQCRELLKKVQKILKDLAR